MSDSQVSKKLGDQFREAREKKNLTQAEVAKNAGITINYYARIERGEENPTAEVIDSIARALKTKISFPL